MLFNKIMKKSALILFFEYNVNTSKRLNQWRSNMKLVMTYLYLYYIIYHILKVLFTMIISALSRIFLKWSEFPKNKKAPPS